MMTLSAVMVAGGDAIHLGDNIALLVAGAIDGLITDLVLVAAPDNNEARALAEAAGATLVSSEADFGTRLSLGCQAARQKHVLVIDAVLPLPPDWLIRLGGQTAPCGLLRKLSSFARLRRYFGLMLAGEAYAALLLAKPAPINEKADTFASAFALPARAVRAL